MILRAFVTLAGLLLASTVAMAQTYPNRPIRVLVGFAAGGATDVLARVVADGLNQALGQPVVVENKPGANATIATELVAKSPPDGYTLLVASVGSLAIAVNMDPKPNYDTLKDFAPVSLLAVNDGVLIVKNDFPAKNFGEFVKVLKGEPGKYGYGTSGNGSPTHLAGELLKRVAGISMNHIPYRGDAQAIGDVVGGHLPIGVNVMASASSQVKGGAVRAIAALGSERLKDFPDLPTVAESGYPGYSGGSWIGLLAPAGTPPDVVKRLNEISRAVMAKPDVAAKLEASGSRITTGSSEEFASYIAAEIKKWGQVVTEANIKP